MSPALLHTFADVARHVGVTPPTVRAWVEKGWLTASGPWTTADARAAAARSRQRAGRGAVAAHGTASRWRAGCSCEACRAAHNAESRDMREAARVEWWADREAPLLEALAGGVPWREALAEVGATAQAVTAHRYRSPAFAAALDAALMEGRDQSLEHGTAGAWRAGCRCPECREYHEGTRT